MSDIGYKYLRANSFEEFLQSVEDEGSGTSYDDGSGSYYGDDGSTATHYSDGSGSYYGDDGSTGTRYSDGSGSFYGDDGSTGTRYSDGSGSFYFADGSCESWYADEPFDPSDSPSGDSSSDDGDLGIGSTIAAAAIGAGIFAAAVASSKRTRDAEDSEPEYDPKEIEREIKRRERAKKREAWWKSPSGKKAKKIIAIITLVAILACIVLAFASTFREVSNASRDLIGVDRYTTISQLNSAGFKNIKQNEICDLAPSQADQDGLTTSVKVGPFSDFDKSLTLPNFIEVEVTFHTLMPINPPLSSDEVKGKQLQDVESAFEEAGFINITLEAKKDVVFGVLFKENDVIEVRIAGRDGFDSASEVKPNAQATIVYHAKVFE